LHRDAAGIFRLARSKGFSLTTIDALIAAIALENRAAIFTLDKDFHRIASITYPSLHRLTYASAC
jgi:predicted nucleic acid-binding protein